ncbi:alpha/beta hydrolase [Bradyrhizobium sp. SSUT18]|uniref:alpha/beta fold hydrolase n=1 Tax=Bradyrhizobium sp. SSUT18 TaxID=3040602 RepID=UPI00244D6ACC|nr:alpha/beta hydrolase [Bradyrhizobium sp. SSUT18]MDH2401825.1 alpha/beta hydrolase [Bradyrhizobium sp. SSUT18]
MRPIAEGATRLSDEFRSQQMSGTIMTAEKKYESIWTHLADASFHQGYVDAGGIKTRYINGGPKGAPKLIMLHGLGGSWENSFANFPVHAEHFDTYAFDLLGHGYTDKPNRIITTAEYVNHVRNCMDALKIEKASFLGISLGSWIATKLAAANPERVEKVTMVSAWGRASAAPDMSSPFFIEGNKIRMAAAENPTWPLMEKIFAGLIGDPEQRMPDLLGIRLKIYGQPGMRQAMENIFKGLDHSWTNGVVTDEEARSVKSSYLIIAAVDRKDSFLACSYEYAKLIPNARVVELRGATHWAQWEALDEFNRVNLEFLRS